MRTTEPIHKTGADLAARAILDSGLVADCTVLVRESARGGAEAVAYVVPAYNVSPVHLKRQLSSLLEERGCTCLAVVVSALPLTADGETDRTILAQLPVYDPRSFPAWEALVRTQCRCDSVSIEEIDSPAATTKVHVSDLAAVPARTSLNSADAHAVDSVSVPLEAASKGWNTPLSISVGPLLPTMPGLPEDLGGTLLRTSSAFPQHGLTYLYDDGSERRETYPELLHRAQRIVGGLRALGLSAGDKVIFQFREPRQFVGAFWACQLGGFVPVPIAEAPSYEQPNATLTKLEHAWELFERPLILTRASLVTAIETLEGLSRSGSVRVAAIEELETRERDETRHPCSGADLALLLLTSGSSGAPKAVMQSHRSLLARSLGARLSGGFGSEDVTLNWLPMDHVGGVVMFAVGDVFFGCNEILAEPDMFLQRPLSWLDWIDRFRVTFSWAPNFAFGLVNKQSDVATQHWDLSCLRFLLNGGEAVVPRVARRFLELLEPYGLPASAMRPAWGMSETSSGVIYSHQFSRATTSDDDQFTVVGHPIHGFAMRIVNEANVPVPEGRVGRLQVSGACVTSGYYRDVARTAESFTPDGWFVTGDLGVIRDGALTITGREKAVIIINGANYQSHEIESVVDDVAGLETSFTAACPVRRRDSGSEDVAIFFVPAGSSNDSPVELVRAVADVVRRRIGLNPGYILPLTKRDIPKTEIGKIQRTALSQRFESGQFDRQLKELDLELDNERVIPNWFARREWQRKNLAPLHRTQACRAAVIVAADASLLDHITAGWSARGWDCVGVLAASEFTRDSPRRYRMDTRNPDDFRRLWSELAEVGFHLESVVDLHAVGPVASVGAAGLDLRTVLALVQTLSGSPFAGRALRLQVVTTEAHWIADNDPAPWRASLGGLLRTVPQEYPSLECRHVDVQHESTAAEMIEQIAAESTCVDADATVAYRGGHRYVPRFTPLQIGAREDAPLTMRAGGLYVISGGAGGIGRMVARWLVEQFDAHVLLFGRRSEAAVRQDVSTNGVAPDSIDYRSVDVTDAAAVHAAVTDVEQRVQRPLAGIFHLAGAFQDAAIEQLTPADLDAALTAKTAGTVVLADLAARRSDCLLVIFSSVNGFFGGVSAGAYAAANSFVDEFASYRSAHGQRVQSLAWTLWDETGMSVGYAMKDLSRRRGFFVLQPWAAMASLAYAVTRTEPALWIGLDTSRPAVSQHCRGECRSLVTPVASVMTSRSGERVGPRSVEVADEFGNLVPLTLCDALPQAMGAAAAASTSQAQPANAVEHMIVELWTQVLSRQSVGVDENFFDCGGSSISLALVNAALRKRLGRPIPMPVMFQHPTVRGLASHLNADRDYPSLPVHVGTEDRGSLRRARMQQRRIVDAGKKIH